MIPSRSRTRSKKALTLASSVSSLLSTRSQSIIRNLRNKKLTTLTLALILLSLLLLLRTRPYPPPVLKGQSVPRKRHPKPTPHPLSDLLTSVFATHPSWKTLLDSPCRAHRDISPRVLAGLRNVRYICHDTDSQQLATSHAQIRNIAPNAAATFTRRLPEDTRVDVVLMYRTEQKDVRAKLLRAASMGGRIAVVGVLARSEKSPGRFGINVVRRWGRGGDKDRNFEAFVRDFLFGEAVLGVAQGYGRRLIVVYDLTVVRGLFGDGGRAEPEHPHGQ